MNPFVIDSPLPPSEIIDREAESAEMLARAQGGHNTRLSAPRRYGKTTLIRKLSDDAAGAGLNTVVVDFYGVLSPEDLFVRLDRAYAEGLRGPIAEWYTGLRRKWQIGGQVGPPGAKATAQAAETVIMERLHELLDLPKRAYERSGKGALIVFDEFQDVLTAAADMDGVLRSRIQHHTVEASYVFAGSHPGLMAELFGSKKRPLFDQARPIELPPLPDSDLAEYIGRKFTETGRTVGRALEPLLAVARGHPQRAMLLAHHLWEQTEPAETADEEHWNRAFDSALRELQEAFERTWDSLSPNERRVLAAVAWIGPWGAGGSLLGQDTLNRFKLSKTTAANVRDDLVRKGELAGSAAELHLTDPLFEAWIASGRRSRAR
jgi:hypothetical protein